MSDRCRRGHVLSEVGTTTRNRCLACKRLADRHYRARQRDAEPPTGGNYYEGGRYLDGPKLVEWLGPMVPPEAATSGPNRYRKNGWVASLRRRMRDWEKGTTADLYILDPYLVHLGLHPTQIPDDIWTTHWRIRQRQETAKC